jgi:glycosyltransferase involved in cell wall biosynthesis
VRPRVLVLIDYYLPGFKAGGPLRSVGNLVEALGDELEFLIVTRDRDFDDQTSYPGVDAGTWVRCGRGLVCYLPRWQVNWLGIWRVLRSAQHDVLYLNSVFSPVFTVGALLLRRFGLLASRPTIVAARGEFSPGALHLKRLKKRLFLIVAKRLGLYRGVIWQASSDLEREDIRSTISFSAKLYTAHHVVVAHPIVVAPDLLGRSIPTWQPSAKQGGCTRVVFCSRISRKKNLAYALRVLRTVSVPVEFDIIGPIDDAKYWKECETLIRSMPRHVRARHLGVLPNEQVHRVLSGYDLFFLPTLGENFGHAILEALSSGVPVLISDQTPWRSLRERGAGWDLPLEATVRFREAIEACAAMSPAEGAALRAGATLFARAVMEDDGPRALNRYLFLYATGQVSGPGAQEVPGAATGPRPRMPGLAEDPPLGTGSAESTIRKVQDAAESA